MTDALDAVIDAALERALLDANDARRYFALAGALERGRSATRADGTGTTYDHAECSDVNPKSPDAPTDALGAALLTTAAVGALDTTENNGIDPDAWSPGGGDGPPGAEVVAVGAAAACRRFDVELGTLADRSGLPPEQLERYQNDGDTTGGPR